MSMVEAFPLLEVPRRLEVQVRRRYAMIPGLTINLFRTEQ